MGDFNEIRGNCQCGSVHYRVNAPARDYYHCHCSICRRLHGTLFGTYAIVERDAVTIEQGEDALGSFDSTPGVHRLFCGNCGCQLFARDDNQPDIMWFTPGTADGDPGALDKERHVYIDSKAPWHEIRDDLPKWHDDAGYK